MRENDERASDGDPVYRMPHARRRRSIARIVTGVAVAGIGTLGGGHLGGRVAVEGSHLALGLEDGDPAAEAASREVQEKIEALRRDSALRQRLDNIAAQSARLKETLPSWVEVLPDWESIQAAKMFLQEHVTFVVDWLENVLAFLAEARAVTAEAVDHTVDQAKAIAGDAVTAMKEKTIALVDGLTGTVGTLIGGLTGLLVGLYAHRRAWDAATQQRVTRIEDAVKALREIRTQLAVLKKGDLREAELAELNRLTDRISEILMGL